MSVDQQPELNKQVSGWTDDGNGWDADEDGSGWDNEDMEEEVKAEDFAEDAPEIYATTGHEEFQILSMKDLEKE